MLYTIGEAAKQIGVPASTLRYYDKEGLLFMDRSAGGIRMFSDNDLQSLRVIECLKRSGLSIKEIRQYMAWCREGDGTIEKRRQMFYDRREAVRHEMAALQDTLDTLEYKCWFYDTAVASGSTETPSTMPLEKIPAKVRAAKIRLQSETLGEVSDKTA